MKHLWRTFWTLGALIAAWSVGASAQAALTLTLDIEDVTVPYSAVDQTTDLELYFTLDGTGTMSVTQMYFALQYEFDHSQITLRDTANDGWAALDDQTRDWLFYSATDSATVSATRVGGLTIADYTAEVSWPSGSTGTKVVLGKTYELLRIPVTIAGGLAEGTYPINWLFTGTSVPDPRPRIGGSLPSLDFYETPQILVEGDNEIGSQSLKVVASGGGITITSLPPNPVPEPATWFGLISTLAAGGLGLVWRRRRAA